MENVSPLMSEHKFDQIVEELSFTSTFQYFKT